LRVEILLCLVHLLRDAVSLSHWRGEVWDSLEDGKLADSRTMSLDDLYATVTAGSNSTNALAFSDEVLG
jgi:hypothetical protein